eukprot:11130495-Prorocentrum_lima.AAC.1
MGIEDFVQFALSRGHSTYHLSGFLRLDQGMKEFVTQTGMGGYVMDSRLANLLEDDRLLMVMRELQHDIEDEMSF